MRCNFYSPAGWLASSLVVLAIAATTADGAPSADLVSSLPSLEGNLPSKLYSGFLDVEGSNKRLHYLFVESQRNPEEDPLVLWLNGG